jgi:hypothetical protein
VKFKASNPGTVISALGHAALLAATLVVFSDAPQFKEAEESVPVEVITNEQFNQIMRGEKTAKETKPLPPRAEKISEQTETRPTPVIKEAKVVTAAPVQAGKREPDPGQDEKPVPAPQQKQVTPTPPPTPKPPEPVKEPPKPEPPKEAEVLEKQKPQEQH